MGTSLVVNRRQKYEEEEEIAKKIHYPSLCIPKHALSATCKGEHLSLMSVPINKTKRKSQHKEGRKKSKRKGEGMGMAIENLCKKAF